MSVPGIPPSPPRAPPPARRRGPGRVVSVILVLIGIVLLLPGICSLFFMVVMPGSAGGAVALLWLVSFVIGIAGILLIRYALGHY